MKKRNFAKRKKVSWLKKYKRVFLRNALYTHMEDKDPRKVIRLKNLTKFRSLGSTGSIQDPGSSVSGKIPNAALPPRLCKQ